MSAGRYAFILAGTASGCGKTTVTLGLLGALKRRGLRVQPCKVGPDYLDTGWHSAVSGVPSRNLDSFMLPESTLNALFNEQMRHADVAVIEGVMGLYDGYGTDPDYCSTAAMARQLGCPVILLVDGKAVSTSIAATVMGFQHFDPRLNIAGVIVNRVNSDSHYQLLKTAIEHYCELPVLGYVPVQKDISLPERHLGLVSARESGLLRDAWQGFSLALETTLDIDRLLALCPLPHLPVGVWPEMPTADAGAGLTLALADDDAFNFYYPDNLQLLEQAGVRIVRFSPLHDRTLPECQMIWFGGGYPELHAAQLAANEPMLAQIRAAHRRGVAIYGECGGLMALGDTLCDLNGETHRLAGILPGHSRMGTKLTRFGYCEARATTSTLLAAAGEILRGHEFHYSDFTTDLPATLACRKTRDGEVLRQWAAGWQVGNTFASYLHLHFAQRPTLLNHWFNAARRAL
ncbi:hydrogenobyrinic acid a,c-diamide synthase (glutamine-hydrolysing) /cobyrinate a,c-diamide synthase [Enterobacter sp. BIGb0383]|uniref:cobyrinate a,c-diamide synthase n=1 Tax=unclassified Enterobacter TaxID=2608935 RepID=UPI000F476F72|nr:MULTISPECIES: cobyrinate a,c-diamide synthase [unclassified Enterobacter]ROP62656.1 hydrogenobyrinic acid a,c-diamide synthase (glutamine-hydrolysing) /cobyrinate a,c-diamide synthase [Enterobacter sp. BIGb0383]ROS12817.1 hydrogenobyrinic acid a,c-diamide synthase (glutamine-hydrolysing) /cobyrinate a,c-diamide synthase [Enterobacter sp. BIGb0359]